MGDAVKQLEIRDKAGSEYSPIGVDAENVDIPVTGSSPTTLDVKATEWDTKLRALAGAQPNKIETISVRGTPLPINNKNVEISGVGHSIVNNSGTVLTQRSKLQFKNLKVADSASSDTTIVTGPEFTVTESKEVGTLKINL